MKREGGRKLIEIKSSSVASTALHLHCSLSPHDRASITLFSQIRKVKLREASESAPVCEMKQ